MFAEALRTGDCSALPALLRELEFRKTRAMGRLRDEVTDWMEQNAPTSSAPDSRRASAAPPSEPVEAKDDEEPSSSESPPCLRARGASPGTPETWLPSLSTDLQPPADLPAGRRPSFIWALEQLIAEIRQSRRGVVVLPVRDGRRLPAESGRTAYQFSFEGDAENLFEGANVLVAVGLMKVPGRIAGVVLSEKLVVVETDTDLGETVPAAELRIDNTAMLEQLAKRLREVDTEGAVFNTALADAVLANQELPPPKEIPALQTPPGFKPLNAQQHAAAAGALQHPLFYLWGPPGTGKTVSLTAVVYSLAQQEGRTLICSNTNQAVDQVLLKICEATENTSLLREGRVLRVGRIEHPELKRYDAYVSLPQVVERLGAKLKSEKTALEESLRQSAAEQERLERALRAFAALEASDHRRAALDRELAGHRQRGQAALTRVQQAEQEIRQARTGIAQYQQAGLIKRAFLTSPEQWAVQIQRHESQQREARAEQERSTTEEARVRVAIESVQTEKARLQAEVAGLSRANCTTRLDRVLAERKPKAERLAAINRELAELEERLLREAKVLGATVTKLFLSPASFAGCTTVIVDEASMVLPPALYHAAGLAKDRVVVSGDFRQLSPIAPTNQQTVHAQLGRDVFALAGISVAVAAHQSPPRLQMLRQQHRMASPICELISGPIYDGQLTTAPQRQASPVRPPDPFAQPITLVDTSELHPFLIGDSGQSHYNVMHALVARNVALHLTRAGFHDFGICTSFRAQTKLLREMLKGVKLEPTTGTVHRFQGDEKPLMIVDVPEGFGRRGNGVGKFVQGESPDDEGPRMMNVALSRAKDHVVLLVNRRFLDRRLPNHALVRDILFRAQQTGRILDAREVLAWETSDWSAVPPGAPFSPGDKRGLFRERDFASAVQADLTTAKQSVVIFSAFVTEARVASYGEIFRQLRRNGVKVRCVVRPAGSNGSMDPVATQRALAALKAVGCAVDLRSRMHEKAVFIDEEIAWVGSLNPLSHTAQTSELMVRFQAATATAQLVEFLGVPELGRHRAFAEKENPVCPQCGEDTVLHDGSYGRFFTCAGEDCNWRANPRQLTAKKPAGRITTTAQRGPECPDCRTPTLLKTGPWGAFYGCANYPRCKRKFPVETK